ncbi:MAG TPA: hypothetical protein DHV64_10725 [Erythrobacter sp.]|jgi:glycosyltransferase involved in cell wall biosynthesis|nr:hypothetical protein [Erythrobacter sp.]|tara:strand:- start:16142 stop:17356 length:1215 start_codon:yes stop_codon:yes gene_type:complete
MSTIIYVGGFELPDRNAAAQRVCNNASIFRDLGYKVILLGTSRERSYDGTVYPAAVNFGNVEAWEVGYPASKGQWFDMICADWPLRRLVETGAVDPADVAAVICYNHPAIAQARLARLAHSWGASAFADCTEWYGTRSWTAPANVVKNIDVAMRMRWVNLRMDGIITTSPYMTQHYSSNSLPVVEIPTLIEEPGSHNARMLATDTPLPLLAVASGFGEGTLEEDVHDRIDWILELLDRVSDKVPPFVLSIAGVDRERYLSVFPQHRQLLERLGAKVNFLGRIPRVELLGRLQKAAFAFVLRHESRVTLAGFPSKYSEAITYGTPVIVNKIPSIASYHVETCTGFTIDTDDRDKAAAALGAILKRDRAAIEEMRRYCRESHIFNASNFVVPVQEFLNRSGTRPGA